MKALRTRVEALEGAGTAFIGPAIWLDIDDGDTVAGGIAKWEAEHGPRKPGQLVVAWVSADAGERAPCA